MKFADIEKATKNIRRAVGKKYGYRQSDYINWKIKDGYFFCLDTLHIVHTSLKVKPLFLDDLYWSIIYPNGKEKLPESLRGNGALAHLCGKIWEEWFPEKLKNEFTPEIYEQILDQSFHQAEAEIDSFLQKYPSQEMFGQFLIDNNVDQTLTEILIAIKNGDFQLASELASVGISCDRGVKIYYLINDSAGNEIEKSDYEFILDYCRKHTESVVGNDKYL